MTACTIIAHDDDGFVSRIQGSSYSAPISARAGFVFYSEALDIAQSTKRPWSRWFPDEVPAGAQVEKRKTLRELRIEARAAIANLAH